MCGACGTYGGKKKLMQDYGGNTQRKEIILKKQDGRQWNGVIWLRIGTSAGSCKHSNDLLS